MRIITVHGTFAGDTSEEGTKWWQRGSAFCNTLEQKHPSITVEPFKWDDGPNSELARREAGGKLHKRLTELEGQLEPYLLIGHSHGGSVIYSALLHSVTSDSRLRYLDSWITVGTPFLDFRRKQSFFSRLTALELAVLVWSFGYIAMPASIFFALYRDVDALQALSLASNSILAWVIASVYVLSFIVGVAGLLILDHRRRRFASLKSKRLVADWYEDRWKGFCHPDDEALSALTVTKSFSAQLVRKDYLVPMFATIAAILSILVIVGFSAVLLTLLPPPNSHITLDQNLQALGYTLSNPSNAGQVSLLVLTGIIASILCVAGIWLGAHTYVEVSKLAGLALGALTYRWVNSHVVSLIKEKTWGADTNWEEVVNVRTSPPEFTRRPVQLTKTAIAEISDACDRYASLVVARFRSALGSSTVVETQQDLLWHLLRSMDWRGLIHTSYFDVEGARLEIIAAVETRPRPDVDPKPLSTDR